MKNKITIVTHDGKFHADDVFAVATIQLAFGDKEFVVHRTRDEDVIDASDYVVDIGGVCDLENNKFDHHQIGGAGKRENGIPYASFGLAWRKFGEQICGSEEVAFRIDAKLVQCVDAIDNGVDLETALFSGVRSYSVVDIVSSYRPTWREESGDLSKKFFDAVVWARTVLVKEIGIINSCVEAEKNIEEQYKKAEDKQIIIFDDESFGFGREIIGGKLVEYSEPIYAVFYRPDSKQWQILAISKNKETFETREPFPKSWRGLSGKELVKITEVSDAVFCHRTGFMCVAKTKEGAINLAEIALKA